MQTNSPPKLDTTKHTCIFYYHKQSMYLPLNKTNKILTFHLDLPLFVTYWQRQLIKKETYAIKDKRKKKSREHKTIQFYRK